MKRTYLCKFAKVVSTVYRRAISAIRNIKFLLWFAWVTSCFNSGTIPMVKHVTFLDFFGNFLKGPIQYSLVQSQRWKHQKNVPNMFIVNIKETRMTLLTWFCRLYCCNLWTYSTHLWHFHCWLWRSKYSLV